MGASGGDFSVQGTDGAAIQRAIDAAAAAGGGRVVMAPGIYPSGSLRLRDRVELHLEKDAVIRGSTNTACYFDFPADVTAVCPENSAKVFVYAWDAADIAITGAGVIDGQGPAFFDHTKSKWGVFWDKPAAPRPRMVQFVRCRNVRLQGVTFKDSPGWTMLIRKCENFLVDGITVDSNQKMINSDGIDIDSCRCVRVANSSLKTGDDCLILRAMREPGTREHAVCEDVVVTNCTLDSACQTIRMGCPSDDTIRHAVFRDIRATGNNGIFFDYPVNYLRPDDEGFMDISDITFENYSGSFRGSALQIVAGPGVKIRGVRDVVFRDFCVQSAQPLRFVGNADSVLANVVLEDVTAEVSGKVPYEAVATEPLVLKNCTFNGAGVPDARLVTPRGARQPLVRRNVSWETKPQKKK